VKTLTIALFLGLVITPAALAGSKPVLAPLNPDFVKALEERRSGPPVTEDGRVLGHIPSPLNLDHLRDQIPRLPSSARQFPARYSICDEGKCPPVKDQGSCGSCWAFGAYGSVESTLLPDEEWDFSENNMIMHHDFNNGPCSGGGRSMAAAYLVRWSGPVLEEDDPYLDYSSPPGLPERKHVQEVYWVSAGSAPYSVDLLDYIKYVLMNYGGLYWAYMHSGSYYNSSNAAYYYPGSSGANHAVTLVGWDDDFSRNNFNNTPPGDGAYILRNSWGTGFGLDGFYYASYYDASIEALTAFARSEELTNYSFVYQYDWLGWTSALGAGGFSKVSQDPEVYWGANIFEAGTDEWLAATSFYTASYNSSYRILVYTDVVDHPSDGTLAGETAGTFEYPGYHTVPIDDMNVLLSAGTRFSIVVEFNTPGYEYPVPVERRISGYTSAAEASYGESFIRATENDDWLDLHGEYSNAWYAMTRTSAPPTAAIPRRAARPWRWPIAACATTWVCA
jgi:C1A family cysteine protease